MFKQRSCVMDKYVIAFYAVISTIVFLVFSILGGYSINMTRKASRLENQYNTLLHERNLIDQNYAKMRREYEEKEEIYMAQQAKLKRLEEAETLDEYIRLWQEVAK